MFLFFFSNDIFFLILIGWEVECGLGASLLLQFFQLAVYSRQSIHDSLLALIVTHPRLLTRTYNLRLLADRTIRLFGEPLLHVQYAEELGK